MNNRSASPGRVVVVVDGYSTGRFYASELRKRGFRPCHLTSGVERACAHLSAYLAHTVDEFKRDYDYLLEHGGDLEITSRTVANLRPAAILAGCESAVEFTDALAEKLGLAGNHTASSAVRRDKYLMQQALTAAGLRSIRSFKTNSLEELLAFAQSVGSQTLVLKPLRSAGTDGVHFCRTQEELRSAFKSLLGSQAHFGEINDAVLAQEFIEGREVVVNTVSAGGRHAVSDVWTYNKVVNAGAPVYDHTRLAVKLDNDLQDAIAYCMAVLDAMGIRQGPAHAEIMITDAGPVLVECAARPMGGGFPQELIRECLGHTQIEWSIDSYLDEKQFERWLSAQYKAEKHFLIKSLISTRQGELAAIPSVTLLSGLRSIRSGDFVSVFESHRVERTVDISTSPAYLCLCHEDEDVLIHDADLVRALELEAQNELFELAPAGSNPAVARDWFSSVPDAFWFKSDQEAFLDAQLIARALNITEGLELLDCPCGDCRMGLHLAALGVKYTGVDLNPRFIQKAGERFARAELDADLSVSDMRNIDYRERFDIVLNWFNSFGYFCVEEDFEMLKRFAGALKPGGRLLLEAPNANALQNIGAKHENTWNALSPVWDNITERLILEASMPDDHGAQNVVIGMRVYSLNQLKLLFCLAGLKVTQVWSGDLGEFKEDAQRMIIIAEK
jgi:biotin carboxylase/SAM-dependent methyltransferase